MDFWPSQQGSVLAERRSQLADKGLGWAVSKECRWCSWDHSPTPATTRIPGLGRVSPPESWWHRLLDSRRLSLSHGGCGQHLVYVCHICLPPQSSLGKHLLHLLLIEPVKVEWEGCGKIPRLSTAKIQILQNSNFCFSALILSLAASPVSRFLEVAGSTSSMLEKMSTRYFNLDNHGLSFFGAKTMFREGFRSQLKTRTLCSLWRQLGTGMCSRSTLCILLFLDTEY